MNLKIMGAIDLISLKADLSQDINWANSIGRWLNVTFPWKKCSSRAKREYLYLLFFSFGIWYTNSQKNRLRRFSSRPSGVQSGRRLSDKTMKSIKTTKWASSACGKNIGKELLWYIFYNLPTLVYTFRKSIFSKINVVSLIL